MAARLVICPERIFTGEGAPALTGHAVLIEDGRIAALDRREAFAGRDIPTVHHPGCTLLPGLIDAHVHLELTPGPDHETTLGTWMADRDAGLLGLRALAHARAALTAGITTVRDCGSSRGVLAVRDAIASSPAVPRLLVTGPPVTTPRGHCHWFGGVAGTRAEIRRLVASLCDAGVDAVKVIGTGGMMTAGSDPGLPQYAPEGLRTAIDTAHRRGVPVVVHANATVGIARAFAAGGDVIDHVGWLDPDGSVRPDPALISALGAARHLCGMTTSGIVRKEIAEGPVGRARLVARFTDKVALFRAGARIHLHSDAGVRMTPIDRPDLGLRTAAAGTGLPLSVLLAMMTSQAAAAIGREGDLGRIAPGARADLLLVAGDPTIDAGALHAVREVRRDGVVVATGTEGGVRMLHVAG